MGATIKGIITGLAAGLFARKVNSLIGGALFGLAVGFVLSFLVAYNEHGHYVNIVTAGSIVGLILGVGHAAVWGASWRVGVGPWALDLLAIPSLHNTCYRTL